MNRKTWIYAVLFLAVAGPAIGAENPNVSTRAQVLKVFSASSAAFVENVGQIPDPAVRYAFYGSGTNVFHTAGGPVFQLFRHDRLPRAANQHPDQPPEFRHRPGHPLVKTSGTRYCTVRMSFVGARQVQPAGLDKQEAKFHYLMGNDPNRWHTNVATYTKVVYPQLYEGIDLYTFGHRSHLKYELHVAPGADHKQIVIAYDGIDGLTIDGDGALHVKTALGELVDDSPYIYQIIDGRVVQLPGRYRLTEEGTYTFEIAAEIDCTAELVIDPNLAWAHCAGSTYDDAAYDVAVGPDGCVYVTGAHFVQYLGTNVLLQKLGPAGQSQGGTTLIGGSGDDWGYGIAFPADGGGDVLVTGATDSDNFPGDGFEGGATFSGGGIDAFVAKVNPVYGSYSWSKCLGGTGDDLGYDIDVQELSGARNIFVTGATTSPNLPPDCNCNTTDTNDLFLAKITETAGSPQLQWCKCRGGDGDDWGYAVCVDDLGWIITVGATDSQAGLEIVGSGFTEYGGGIDVYVAKFDSSGTVAGTGAFCGYLGGSGDDAGYGVATGTDDEGHYALLTGYTKSPDFPASGGFDSSYCCDSDAFVARINYLAPEPCSPFNGELAWSSYLGGSWNDEGRSIAVVDAPSPPESEDYALLTGFTSSYNFPTPKAFCPANNGGADAFVSKVLACGQLVWSSYLGGSGNDYGYGIAVDPNGDILVAGATDSNDFGTAGTPNPDYKGGMDGFIAKISTGEPIGVGKLYGNVWHEDGQPAFQANVTIPGQATTTNEQGQFNFDFVPAGYVTAMVTMNGYYPAAKLTSVDANSTTWVNIQIAQQLALTEPCVVQVSAKYCGPGMRPCYVHGPSLYEKFMATVDWGAYNPYQIRWTTTLGGDTDDTVSGGSFLAGSPTVHGRCFNMGKDFGPGGTLTIVATGKNALQQEASSAPFEVDVFDVIALPPFIDPNDADDQNVVRVVYTGNGFEYLMLVPGFDMAPWGEDNDMPLFKGEDMNVGLRRKEPPQPGDAAIIARVNSDGTSDIFAEGWNPTSRKQAGAQVKFERGIDLPKLPKGIDVEATASVQFAYTYEDPPGQWEASGGVDIGVSFAFSTPYYFVAVVGPVPVYSSAEVGLGLGVSSGLSGWQPGNPEKPKFESSFYFEPLAKGILAAGIADVACVEGYLGGGFHGEAILKPELAWPEWAGQYIILVGGVEVTVGPVSVEGGQLRYSWWPNPGASKVIHKHGFQSLGTDYRNPGVEADLAANEGLVEPNEFPYCLPELVRLSGGGDDMLMVWLHDVPSRHANNRTELRYATYQSGTWEKCGPVADNNKADMNPQLVALPNGEAACIWQNAKETLEHCTDIGTLNGGLEIAVAKYNSSTGWSNMELDNNRLTNDPNLDRSPKLAVDAGTGDMMAVWVSNADCNMWGDSSKPNKIRWSRYTSSSWGPGSTIADPCSNRPILGTTVAYKDGKATYVYCIDSDDNLTTAGDQALRITRYYDSNNKWDTPTSLTEDDDGCGDAAPRLIYDKQGNLLLFWARQGEIRMATESNFGNLKTDPNTYSELVAASGGSAGIKDFDVVLGDQGQIAVIWSDVSVPLDFPESLDPGQLVPECIDPNCIRNDPHTDHYDPNRIPVHMDPNCLDPSLLLVSHDIRAAYRDPTLGRWSIPRRLTWDDAAEAFVSGAFESDGSLLCVYNKRQTEYNPVDCNCTDCNCADDPNHHAITVASVPVAGKRSDLVYLTDSLAPDLSLVLEDVRLEPMNPKPGTWVEVCAEVRNLGISPASNITVNFADDSPGGGTWFPSDGNGIITGSLCGGEANEVSVRWQVPQSVYPRTMSVKILSWLSQKNDSDSNNHSVSFKVLAPDLTIGEMTVQSAGPNTVITVRVANQGVLPAYDRNDQVEVVLKDANGTVLGRDAIERVEPSAYHDVSFELSPLLSGVEMVYAILDEPNSAQADPDGDGDIDLADYAVVAEHWLCRTCSSLLDDWWCGGADLNMNGEVNWSDLAIVRMHWLGQLQDENGDIDEFNEDNNVRSVRIR